MPSKTPDRPAPQDERDPEPVLGSSPPPVMGLVQTGPSGPSINPVDNLRKRLNEITEGTSVPALLPIRKAGTFSLSVLELRKAAAANPKHKHSKVFIQAVKDFPPGQTVTVDRVDLQALLEDGSVEHRSTIERTEAGSVRMMTKHFVPKGAGR